MLEKGYRPMESKIKIDDIKKSKRVSTKSMRTLLPALRDNLNILPAEKVLKH